MYTVKDFMTIREAMTLMDLVPSLTFEPGRQGTGYEKAVLPDVEGLQDLRTRALNTLGITSSIGHDCYLLRYLDGSHIPDHKDDAPFGQERHRINVLVSQTGEGGIFFLEGKPQVLLQRDAVIFRPDLERHSVSEVVGGERYVWTMGTLK